jgi:hypothetical protein
VVPADTLPSVEHLFVYATGPMDEALAERYHRKRVPDEPTHLDQQPPRARAAIGAVRFVSLDFAKTEVIQPIELTKCGT